MLPRADQRFARSGEVISRVLDGEALLAEFDVAPDVLEGDLDRLFADMLSRGLIRESSS
jgi:hypothetical protein